jgi:hypothetical protein
MLCWGRIYSNHSTRSEWSGCVARSGLNSSRAPKGGRRKMGSRCTERLVGGRHRGGRSVKYCRRLYNSWLSLTSQPPLLRQASCAHTINYCLLLYRLSCRVCLAMVMLRVLLGCWFGMRCCFPHHVSHTTMVSEGD